MDERTLKGWSEWIPTSDPSPEWILTKGLPMTLKYLQTVPILRSFDEGKAREFYVGWLGFTVDWEHRFEPGLPLYMQVSRAGIVLLLGALL